MIKSYTRTYEYRGYSIYISDSSYDIYKSGKLIRSNFDTEEDAVEYIDDLIDNADEEEDIKTVYLLVMMNGYKSNYNMRFQMRRNKTSRILWKLKGNSISENSDIVYYDSYEKAYKASLRVDNSSLNTSYAIASVQLKNEQSGNFIWSTFKIITTGKCYI